jgi:glyoxylase-like metal-dependent hydrolase (beta-lactamase superfamily II)
MAKKLSIDPDARIGQDFGDGLHQLMNDLAYQRLAIVNVQFIGERNARDRQWVLVDAGIPASAQQIRTATATLFGSPSRPAAIILTHGHFDHVGALRDLAEAWDVPIYAHEREHPYLTGKDSYPPPDPGVGGGLMSALSRFYPKKPVDVSQWLQPLPADGTVPHATGWRWILTPGHSPGHVSLWREYDRTLISGDAVISTSQESAFAVALQVPELHGPPMYYTNDWDAARASVERLAALEPETLVTGHGPALGGPLMREALHTLAREFDQIAVPEQGRYVGTSSKTSQS